MKKNNNLMLMVRDYIGITLGVILIAFGLQYFYVPNQIAGGGLSGLSLVINHYIPVLSVGTIMFLGNLILFAIAFVLVGKDFGAKTIYGSFALSFIIDFMEKVMGSYALTNNPLVAVIVGTIIIGSGVALTFALNASTGGTDILAKIINKYFTINMGIALLMVDLFVVLSGAIAFGLNKGFYGLLAVVMNGLLVDRVLITIEKKKEEKAKLEKELVA